MAQQSQVPIGQETRYRAVTSYVREEFNRAEALEIHAGRHRPPRRTACFLRCRCDPATAPSPHQKLVIFTEHRDTFNYLEQRISTQAGFELLQLLSAQPRRGRGVVLVRPGDRQLQRPARVEAGAAGIGVRCRLGSACRFQHGGPFTFEERNWLIAPCPAGRCPR